MWRLLSTMEIRLEILRISKSFPEAHFASKSDRSHRRPQVLTTANMVKDLGHKNLVLGKILL